jgi:hypothetical protein
MFPIFRLFMYVQPPSCSFRCLVTSISSKSVSPPLSQTKCCNTQERLNKEDTLCGKVSMSLAKKRHLLYKIPNAYSMNFLAVESRLLNFRFTDFVRFVIMVATNRFSVGRLHHRLKHLEEQCLNLVALEEVEHTRDSQKIGHKLI